MKRKQCRYVIPISEVREPIWFPVYVKEKRLFFHRKKGIMWLSVFPTEDGRVKFPYIISKNRFTPVHVDLESGELTFVLMQSKEEREIFERIARNISEEQGVPRYTFRCVECHRLYVLLPKEFIGSLMAEEEKIKFTYTCRHCLLEKGKTMAWGRPLIEDWEFGR